MRLPRLVGALGVLFISGAIALAAIPKSRHADAFTIIERGVAEQLGSGR